MEQGSSKPLPQGLKVCLLAVGLFPWWDQTNGRIALRLDSMLSKLDINLAFTSTGRTVSRISLDIRMHAVCASLID